MIYNLISDPKKQIWINLELYFKRYEFYNFLGIFFKFFLNLKSIYLIFIFAKVMWQHLERPIA